MPGSRRLLLALPLVLLAGTAYAADPALERRVQDLLLAYDSAPTPAQLQVLGPGASEVLQAWAADTDRPSATRARALRALAAFPSQGNRDLLLGQVRDPAAAGILRRAAIHALAAGWGSAESAVIAGFLADPDIQIRIAAAQALGRLPGDVRRPPLEARLRVEPNSAVKSAIVHALATDSE